MAPYETDNTMRCNVRRLRKARGWSQITLAERAGICENTLIALETGRRDTMMITWLLVAEALGVTLADLIIPEAGGGGNIEEKADY